MLAEVIKNRYRQDFSGGPAKKNPATNAENTGSIPSLRRSYMPQGN